MFDILEVRRRGAPPRGPRVTGLEDPPARKVQDRFTSTAPGASCIKLSRCKTPDGGQLTAHRPPNSPVWPGGTTEPVCSIQLKMQPRLGGAEEVAAAITTIENTMTAAPERRRGRRQRQIKNPSSDPHADNSDRSSPAQRHGAEPTRVAARLNAG
jgi:hypothetical protein